MTETEDFSTYNVVIVNNYSSGVQSAWQVNLEEFS